MDKDNTNGNTSIINASEINDNFLIDTFISQFDKNYEVIKIYNLKKLILVKMNG